MPNLRPGSRGNVPHDKEQNDIAIADEFPTASLNEMIVIIPITLVILLVCSLRECYKIRRRDAHRSTVAERFASTQEDRKAKARKAATHKIATALIVKTASECSCTMASSSRKTAAFEFTSGTTLLTDVTDDASTTSSSYDIEHMSSVDRDIDNDDDDETLSYQTCAICLEPYVGGRDRVAWSRFQTCRHAFHPGCIEAWLVETKHGGGSCPCCRGPYLRGHAAEGSREDRARTTEGGAEAHAESGGGRPPGRANEIGATLCTGAEFTSFCIVHGLTSDKEHRCDGISFLSANPLTNQRTALELEEPLLRSC